LGNNLNMATTPPPNPFQTGYAFTPSEIVTAVKLSDIINLMPVDYPQLAENIMNSGSTNPNALIRFVNDQLQLRNATTGLWHSIWISGQTGSEELNIGVGAP
jgi:hypothetical protein